MSDNSDAWVRTIEQFNRTGSFEAAYDTMHDGFTAHSGAGDLTGRDAVCNALETVRNQRNWTRCEILGAVGDGDWVAVIYRQAFGQATSTGASVIHFDQDGKAVEMWSHTDDN